MPPDAFTPISGPTVARINATSSNVAPPDMKPVEVLTKSAPASLRQLTGAFFLVIGQQTCLDDHLENSRATGLFHRSNIVRT